MYDISAGTSAGSQESLADDPVTRVNRVAPSPGIEIISDILCGRRMHSCRSPWGSGSK